MLDTYNSRLDSIQRLHLVKQNKENVNISWSQDLGVSNKHVNLFLKFCQFSVKYLPSTQKILTVYSSHQHKASLWCEAMEGIGNIKMSLLCSLIPFDISAILLWTATLEHLENWWGRGSRGITLFLLIVICFVISEIANSLFSHS